MDPIEDEKFFDNLYQECGPNTDNQGCKDPNCKKPNFLNNYWLVHSSEPLQESIEKYANLPILTDYNDNQPPEGVTVTFDSYPKADGSRKSEYKVTTNQKKKELVIKYNDGIGIEHIMASGTIPEFYKYAQIPINSTGSQKDQDSTNKLAKTSENKDGARYFTDGGVLNNTPFRELLSAHREYWKDVKK